MVKSYEIVFGAILCLRCGLVSHNAHDFHHHYCAWCCMFHDDPPELKPAGPYVGQLMIQVSRRADVGLPTPSGQPDRENG